MAITTVFVLFPFALLGAIVYTNIYFKNIKQKIVIRIQIIKSLLLILIYLILIIIETLILTFLGMILLIGIVGLPALLVFDTIGIVILIKRSIEKRKQKRKDEKYIKSVIGTTPNSV